MIWITISEVMAMVQPRTPPPLIRLPPDFALSIKSKENMVSYIVAHSLDCKFRGEDQRSVALVAKTLQLLIPVMSSCFWIERVNGRQRTSQPCIDQDVKGV